MGFEALNAGSLAKALTAIIATIVEAVVAIIAAPMISAGFAESAAALYAIIVAGISVTEDVLIARKVHMASVAVSSSALRDCNSFMAFNPKV